MQMRIPESELAEIVHTCWSKGVTFALGVNHTGLNQEVGERRNIHCSEPLKGNMERKMY